MKIFSMKNDIEKNSWEVAVIYEDKLYTLIMQFDGYQLQSTTVVYPNGEKEIYTSVYKIMPSKLRSIVLDTIYRDTLEKTRILEERDE